MNGIGNKHRASRGLLLAVSALALAGLTAPVAMGAEAERELDPVLSLIGGCSEKVETLDPIEDPGCPTTLPAGPHPPEKFAAPKAVTTDRYGDIYVSNFGKSETGNQGRIDIFDPDGGFISELKTPGPTSMAIDSKGVLYVYASVNSETEHRVIRFGPTGEYKPATGQIEYNDPPTTLTVRGSLLTGIAINPANDHLFANFGAGGVVEYDSAVAGNAEIRRTETGIWPYGVGVAVNATRNLLYASAEDKRIDIFDLTQVVGSPPNDEYKKVGSIEGSAVPAGKFEGKLSVAVDEATGHVFVLDGEVNRIYEFDEGGAYLATIEHGFNVAYGAEIGIDNGPLSPNGALGSHGHYLYVPSGKTGVGHSFAFEASSFKAPVVSSVSSSGVSEDEAELQAQVNSGNLETEFSFEYTTRESFEAEGFAGAQVAGTGKLPAANLDEEASAVASGLEDGTEYRFRILATNVEGSDEAQGSFATYPAFPIPSSSCPNALLRGGSSAPLPDCRAFELVTPPSTNGRSPVGTGHELQFTNRQVSPAGDKIPFKVEGGALGGKDVTGTYLGDPYLSSRGPSGWNTNPIGPNGAEAQGVVPGGTSPDQGYSFWTAQAGGPATEEGHAVSYVRYPDGHSEVLGKGSIATDPEAAGVLISEGGDHIVFTTETGVEHAVQIEPDAAPTPIPAIYDRTPDGVTHVISLLPGDVPLSVKATYYGSSLDGEGVAFTVANTLYLRYQDSETFEIGENVKFAGVAEGGNRIFYMQAGDLFAFDAKTQQRIAFTNSNEVTPEVVGDAVPVNVSEDGSAAYFVSKQILTPNIAPNPKGDLPETGVENLYLSREGALSFVGILDKTDVIGEAGKVSQIEGLGLWMAAIGPPTVGQLGLDPSRATPDGNTLIFRSRAKLTDYDPEGVPQIYRYDSAGELQCLSCNPTGAPSSGAATLQSESREGFALAFYQAWIRNLRPDGKRAFFESPEPLVAADTDGKLDVYEWEDEGVGSCTRPQGCTYLISSGHSLRNEYLFAVSESGNDAFVLSSDELLPADAEETPSIYDARVEGGFAEAQAPAECLGEACQPTAVPPADPVQVLRGAGNVKPEGAQAKKSCPKGKVKTRRHGKARCLKAKQTHKAASNRKAGRK